MKNQVLIIAFSCFTIHVIAQNNLLPFNLIKGSVSYQSSSSGNDQMYKTGLTYKAGKQIKSQWNKQLNSLTVTDTSLFTYNSLGNVTQILRYYGYPNNPARELFTYNSNGKVVSDTAIFWDGNTYRYTRLDNYFYDVNGNQIDFISYGNRVGSTWSNGYKISDTWTNGNIAEETYQIWNGSVWLNNTKFTNTWSNGNIIQQIFYNWDTTSQAFIPSLKANYTFSSGQCDSAISYNWNGTTWVTRDRLINLAWHKWTGLFNYSEPIGWTKQVPNGSGWKDTSRMNCTYDANGNKTHRLDEAKPGANFIKTYEETHTYQYDANNNILEDLQRNWIDSVTGLRDNIKLNFSQYQAFSGIEQNNINEAAFLLFPNPGNGIIHLQIANNKNTSIAVFNLVGEKIYQSSDITLQAEIDLSAQPKGIYFVQLTSGNHLVNRKIIIE